MKQTRKLLDIMRQLRDPDNGCPWDLKQNFESLAPYAIEEAYEVADAVERADYDDLRGELGDLLLQVVFFSQLAAEQSLFDFEQVAASISRKLIQRHPHVFSEVTFETDQQRADYWERSKLEEQRAKGQGQTSLLDGIAATLPALLHAEKLQKRASRAGFDWNHIEPVLAKLDEELEELKSELAINRRDRIEEELGDLLFTLVNLARHCQVDPERALRSSNRKFINRFQFIESRLQAQGEKMEQQSLQQLDALWDQAKNQAADSDETIDQT